MYSQTMIHQFASVFDHLWFIFIFMTINLNFPIIMSWKEKKLISRLQSELFIVLNVPY